MQPKHTRWPHQVSITRSLFLHGSPSHCVPPIQQLSNPLSCSCWMRTGCTPKSCDRYTSALRNFLQHLDLVLHLLRLRLQVHHQRSFLPRPPETPKPQGASFEVDLLSLVAFLSHGPEVLHRRIVITDIIIGNVKDLHSPVLDSVRIIQRLVDKFLGAETFIQRSHTQFKLWSGSTGFSFGRMCHTSQKCHGTSTPGSRGGTACNPFTALGSVSANNFCLSAQRRTVLAIQSNCLTLQ